MFRGFLKNAGAIKKGNLNSLGHTRLLVVIPKTDQLDFIGNSINPLNSLQTCLNPYQVLNPNGFRCCQAIVEILRENAHQTTISLRWLLIYVSNSRQTVATRMIRKISYTVSGLWSDFLPAVGEVCHSILSCDSTLLLILLRMLETKSSWQG